MMTKTMMALAAAATLAVTAVAAPAPAEAHWRGRGGGALIGGLALGAIAGAAIASSRPAYAYPPGYYGPAPAYYWPVLLLDPRAVLGRLRLALPPRSGLLTGHMNPLMIRVRRKRPRGRFFRCTGDRGRTPVRTSFGRKSYSLILFVNLGTAL